jgi:MFS transporter, DHA3 family, macrolide efflux protein
MAQRTAEKGMRIFILIWAGQLVSLIGSGLTGFVVGVWVYQQTKSVTYLTLIVLCASLPGLLISPLAGALVDRWDRRKAMILADTGASLGTALIALVFWRGNFEIWELCIAVGIISIFGAFQWPAYSAAISLLVPKEHLGRASGLIQGAQAGAQILSPLLAGVLVVTIGVWGVVLTDFLTYLIAVSTLLLVHIPRPETTAEGEEGKGSLLREAAYGWTYIVARPGLMGLLLFFSMINFTVAMLDVLLTPLVLSFASAVALGTVMAFFGAGMLAGSFVMGVWGGPKRRIYGVLGFGLLQAVTMVATGLSANTALIAVAVFILMFGVPIINGSSQAIWQSKVAPDVQGRVFAVRLMLAQISAPLSYLIAGPLCDRVFEPLMAAGGPLQGSVGRLIGSGPGRGIALLLIIMGLLTLAAPIFGFLYPRLRLVEDELPDMVGEKAAVGA